MVISKAAYITPPSSPPLKGGEILHPSPHPHAGTRGEGEGEGALLMNSLVSIGNGGSKGDEKYLINLTTAAVVLTAALSYYYGHSFTYRLMINGPSSLVKLAGR